MEATWKPVVAGVINIVVGIGTLLAMFVIAVSIVGISGSALAIGRVIDFMPLWLSGFAQFIIVIGAFILLVVSALPLIGGFYAVERKNWRWALAGSIVAIFSSAIFGMVSTVLIALSRKEFPKS